MIGSSARRPAAFLDRDGTIIEDVHYIARPDQVRLIDGASHAIRRLNRAGWAVVVITNQSGIARGIISEAFVDETHRLMSAHLEAGGARVDAYYHCPHHPDGKVEQYTRACDCRKPAGGMVDRAVRDLGLDPVRSFVVGDTWLDVGLGRTVGARAILVRTGMGAAKEQQPPAGVTADAVVDNLAAAASWILNQQ